jgi:G:T/U-mismatch repair DNA glycosylase
MTHHSGLKPFLRRELDVLFVALNAPVQSNNNGHWFSGSGSRFFKLLARSGLTVSEVPRETADDVVFGSVERNFRRASFGVVDLVPHLVETNSSKVRPTLDHAKQLLDVIQTHEPRFACVIHSKVRDALDQSKLLTKCLDYGANGRLLSGCRTEFFMNYFPNGNKIPDTPKIAIFKQLRDQLERVQA